MPADPYRNLVRSMDGIKEQLKRVVDAMTADDADTTQATTDARQPAYDAVFAYIRTMPVDFLPATVVERNAMIWHAVNAALDEQQPTTTGTHRYLSTSCLHNEHTYCQSHTGQAGAKTPATCKFCTAPCICPCHTAT